MRRINVSPELIKIHTDAVKARINKSYDKSEIINNIKSLGVGTIEEFLTADVDTLKRWVRECPEKLDFSQFKNMYQRFFSNGADKFVDKDYNAYKFLKELDVTVCPYCDDEYLDIVEIDDKQKRTSEIDHFFPKSRFPALAMCIYNLVPSGQNCNGLKLEFELGADPYESDIESLSFLYPDLDVGVLLDNLSPNECKVLFHPKDGMEKNVSLLALEQRYERHAPEAYRLLRNRQLYSEEKINEIVKLTGQSKEDIISSLFGPQDIKIKKNELRQKMLKDLTGY
ncbi:hypothetical protein SAMN02910447_00428 [Ruminococcus sp. YE71]|uniref:hypothetical protein n=1 Tax=unclassified Ruminococcus TaxID=2608920 RepID=UPI00088DC297|nr:MULTISPECIES: hypothetical protein [unclassified Ruminococcus]SDA11521.1 hypothetical protein SAMN02910446_00427 [Ruminococcus sp. YE78]SFW15349.1 hypothetical protein SAMN02910447_00428 [Ruminococcus sp. YE71]